MRGHAGLEPLCTPPPSFVHFWGGLVQMSVLFRKVQFFREAYAYASICGILSAFVPFITVHPGLGGHVRNCLIYTTLRTMPHFHTNSP